MPQLERWDSLPEVPEGDWYEDFGSFNVCGAGSWHSPLRE
jgi:hypothetical protein